MSDEFAAYMPGIRRRLEAERMESEKRRERAWAEARRVAAFLREEFGAEEVLAFGSLVEEGPFDQRSDIDLAVVGIRPDQFYGAYGAALEVCREFALDLVDLADCSPRLKAIILESGRPV